MIQELYINNQLVDLLPNTRIILNKDFVDLQNPDARISDASLRLKLPKSKKNNIVFGHINAENIVDKFVRLEDFEALYLVNGVIIHNGTFRVLSVDEDGYSGVLLTGVASWSKLLVGKTLRDLKNDDLLTPWEVPFTGLLTGTTQYSLKWYIENGNYLNSDVTFPLISYGTFYSSFISNNRIDEIHNDTLALDNFPPSVYDLKIIKRIFQNIGWTVESSLFSNSEAQKVFIPYTASDRFQWNYGFLFGGQATGSTLSMVANDFFTNCDIKPKITFTNATVNEKTSRILYLKHPTFVNNPQQSFRQETFDAGNGNFTSQSYDLKVSENYSFDFEINNWRIDIEGRNKIRWQVAAGGSPITVCSLTPFAEATGKAVDPEIGQVRVGFCIYIDKPDNSGLPDILDNLNRYIYNFYWDDTNDFLQIDHPNVLAAYVPTTSGVSSSYFFPFNDQADIVVTGDTGLVNFTPYSTTLPFPPGSGGFNYTQDQFFSYTWTGNTRFEFRNVRLPAGYSIKALIFGANSRGTGGGSKIVVPQTCSSQVVNNVDAEKELEYGFSASSINFKFLGNSDNDDINLNISKNLPQIGQLDYIRQWINRYSLFIHTDYVNKKVVFEPYDTYFLPNDFTYDLSGKFDDNFFEPKSEPVVLPKIIQFFYNNDTSDALIGPDISYASVKIQNDNIYCEGNKDISTIFSATKLRQFTYNQSATSSITFEIPSIANIDRFSLSDLSSVQVNYANSPRILKLTGEYLKTSQGTDATLPILDTTVKILLSKFEENDPDKLSLSFYGDYGLYNKFYERYLNEISDSYIITMNCYITPTDWQNLTQNVPVIINGQAYIIYKIKNYDPLNNGKAQISFIRKYTN